MFQAAQFSRMTLRLLILITSFAATVSAHAISGASVETGHGNASTEAARVGARWDMDKRWALGGGWIASAFMQADLGFLQGSGVGKQNLWQVGVTPVIRLRSGVSRFFLEGGIGAQYVSEKQLNSRHSFGSNLLIGDHIGFGWNFGDKDSYEVGYRLQHIANADLTEPNDGISLHLIHLGYNY